MLKIEGLFEYICLAKPRSRKLFSDFPVSRAGVESSDLYLDPGQSTWARPCQLWCFCSLGQTCPLLSPRHSSFSILISDWQLYLCSEAHIVLLCGEPWHDVAGKSQRFSFWLESKPGALSNPSLACQRTLLSMKPWFSFVFTSVVAVPIELGNVERSGNVKTSFVITSFCSFSEINCKQYIVKLSELRHVTWDGGEDLD